MNLRCSQVDLNKRKLKMYLELLLQMCRFSRVRPEGKGFPFNERMLWPISLQSPDPASLV